MILRGQKKMNLPVIVFDDENFAFCRTGHKYKKCYVLDDWVGNGRYFCETCYQQITDNPNYQRISLEQYRETCIALENNEI